jgi:hypothetical protein
VTHTDVALALIKVSPARQNRRALRDRSSRALAWYFFAVTNYFLYGETIVYYFKHIILVDAYVLPFAQRHRFISFILYIIGPHLLTYFSGMLGAYFFICQALSVSWPA